MPQRAIKILSRTCLCVSFSNDVDAVDDINAENVNGDNYNDNTDGFNGVLKTQRIAVNRGRGTYLI